MKRTISRNGLLSLLLIACLVLATALPLGVLADGEKKEDITVSLLFPQNSALRPAMDVSKVWDYIYEGTGIHFDLTISESADQVALMYASRDYPDMVANVGTTAAQLANAAEAGDVVKLDDYFDTLLPSWKDFFEANPIIYNIEKINGGLYSLPWVNQNRYERELRNQWLYNQVWLDELNLDVPKTTADFMNVCEAIKNAAGTGTIPEEVIPFYYRYDVYNAGGQYDIYGSFGVLITSDQYLMVDENGIVVSQAINPDIKAPLKYLSELYAKGLTPPEVFTDDGNGYMTKTSADPAIVFSYSSFANRSPAGVSLPMAPLDSETGVPSYIRKQAYVANNSYCTVVFSSSQYVERILEFLEWAAQPINAVTLNYGTEGVVWDYNADNKIELHFWESQPALMTENAEYVGFVNSWFNALRKEMYAEYFNFPETQVYGTREWSIDNLYPEYTPDWDCVYLEGQLEEDDRIYMNQLYADIKAYRQETFANWIMGQGDIDAEWDGFVDHMKSLGHDEWLELKQKAYDLVAK